MVKIKTIALIFGGRSAEHEVSVVSAKNVFAAIDKKKYEILLIGITHQGEWLQIGKENFLNKQFSRVEKKSGKSAIPFFKEGQFFIKAGTKESRINIVFPVLHGPFGEDGSIQGLLKFFNVPFVGAGILGSAIGMDKVISKRLLREANIPTAKFISFEKNQKNKINFAEIQKNLGVPLFIKPANLGSSVGISKVKNKKEFQKAVDFAFKYDTKIIIEESIKGKEIECSVLGNDNPIASLPGEIIPTHEFYSYKAKYLDKNGAKMAIPANISKKLIQEIQDLAIKTYETLCCEGMGRVDFFLTEDDKIFVSEINTIPGFTSISMYPKLWEASGISYKKLIDKLISLAIERYEKENKLKNSIV